MPGGNVPWSSLIVPPATLSISAPTLRWILFRPEKRLIVVEVQETSETPLIRSRPWYELNTGLLFDWLLAFTRSLQFSENLFDLPGVLPIDHFAFQPSASSFLLNTSLETPHCPRQDHILPIFGYISVSYPKDHVLSKANDRAEIIRTIADIDDFIVISVFFQEGRELFSFAHVGATADCARMLWTVRVNPSSHFE